MDRTAAPCVDSLSRLSARVHKPRLTLKSSATLVTSEAHQYLFTTLTIENIGLSRVDINRGKCWLLVFPQSRPARAPLFATKLTGEGPWRHTTFKVFDEREMSTSSSFWIEPGATQTRIHALSLPVDHSCIAYISEYQIVSGNILFKTDALARVAQPSDAGEE